MRGNLVSRDHIETLTEFQQKVDMAKMAHANGDPLEVDQPRLVKKKIKVLKDGAMIEEEVEIEEDVPDDNLIWVETSEAICKYFVRKGLGKAGYFDYQGVKVCPHGNSFALRKQMITPMQEISHGRTELNPEGDAKEARIAHISLGRREVPVGG